MLGENSPGLIRKKTMTKAELIEKLETVPDDADIIVYDYNGSKTYASEVDITFLGKEKRYLEVFIS